MRVLVVFLVLSVCIPAQASDKLRHFAVSAVASFALTKGLNALLGGNEPTFSTISSGLAVGTAGFAYEVGDAIDGGHKRLDAGDMGANLGGMALGLTLANIRF